MTEFFDFAFQFLISHVYSRYTFDFVGKHDFQVQESSDFLKSWCVCLYIYLYMSDNLFKRISVYFKAFY